MVGGEIGRVFGPIVLVAAVGYFTFRGLPWLMILGILSSIVLFFRLRHETTLAAGDVKPLAVRTALLQIRPLLLPLICISFARSYMEATLTTFMPTFLTEEGSSLWLAGSAISILEFTGVFGALLLGPASDRIGRRIIVFISMLVAPVLMGIFLLLHGWAQIPLLMVLGFTTISIAPINMAIIQEHCPDSRALANGIFMALSFVIYSLNVIIIGRIGDLASLRLAFVISIVLVLLFSPAALFLPKDKRRQGA